MAIASSLRAGGEVSAGDGDRIELAPFAQCSFYSFRLEVVPAIKGVSAYQQGSKFPVSAAFRFILDVIGQFIVELVQVGEFGTPMDFARPPAEDGLMLADAGRNWFA